MSSHVGGRRRPGARCAPRQAAPSSGTLADRADTGRRGCPAAAGEEGGIRGVLRKHHACRDRQGELFRPAHVHGAAHVVLVAPLSSKAHA